MKPDNRFFCILKFCRLVLFSYFISFTSWSHSEDYSEDYGSAFIDLNPTAARFINPDLVTWSNNRIDWVYRTNGRIDIDLFVGFMDKALRHIEKHADIKFTNKGTTSLDLITRYDSSRLGILLVEVLNSSEIESYITDLTSGSVTDGSKFGGYAYIWWDASVLMGQVVLNADKLVSPSCWKGTITHEIGHILNLDHSDSPESIMYETSNRSCEFNETLRYDDIKALHQMYPENEPNYEVMIMENGCLYLPNIEFQGANYQIQDLCIFEVDADSISVNQD